MINLKWDYGLPGKTHLPCQKVPYESEDSLARKMSIVFQGEPEIIDSLISQERPSIMRLIKSIYVKLLKTFKTSTLTRPPQNIE